MTKLEQEIKSLELKQKELSEELEEQRKVFVKFIESCHYTRILDMEKYTDYTNFINTAKELEEIGIKLRTLYYCTALIEQ